MRIAFCHNLKTNDSLEEAEYDTQDTVDRIASALESLGHEVHPVDVNGPVSRVSARLEGLRPQLIFNTAEGRAGRLREAFFPALYEHLGIPATGADSFACALTLDKLASKERVRNRGVPTPRAVLLTVSRGAREAIEGLGFPVIAKPNFEGSSVGISSASVFENPRALEAALAGLLAAFPAGILVEEFVRGRDITVGYLGALTPPILDPTGYEYRSSEPNPFNIYDYRLKNHASDEVLVLEDPGLGQVEMERVRAWAEICAEALEVRDVARFDFRVSETLGPVFLEANATPSLEDGAGLLVAAARRGLSYAEAIGCIVESAACRFGISDAPVRTGSPRPRGLRIGLTYNLKRSDTHEDDREAEFDSPRTIAGLRGALESLGHRVLELEATRNLARLLEAAEIDLVFNIAEGVRGRNREALVPALCELLGLSFVGSDAATLSVCLDKALSKRLLRDAGVPTPAFFVLETGREPIPEPLRWPLIVKPNAEGTSKGLDTRSVVESEPELRAMAAKLIERYRQSVIVEEYVLGREFTVGLVGWPHPRMLEPMEIRIAEPGVPYPVYHYKLKQDFTESVTTQCPAVLSPAERLEIERVSRAAFRALGCLDVARIDFRERDGVFHVLEVNPLPGLSPHFSDLCLVADALGIPYEALVAEILDGALRRAGLGVAGT